jgi:tryptophanyl-tRNA synthetase
LEQGETAELKPYLFSGIQPSGEIHIGNYCGAIKNWVRLLDEYNCLFCIVDYHAITVEYDPSEMQNMIFEAALVNIAAGLDPERCILFVQSRVPEHTELTWIFNTLTPMGLLSRMTQFKEKSKQHEANVNVGLFDYPVLQASDILLYKGEAVPVGEDQVQHVELTRDIARKFNLRYGETFPEPAAVVPKEGARIMGLDGQGKMSKSLNNYIGLLEPSEKVWDKLRPAVTDPARKLRTDKGTPEVCNIYTLHRSFSPPDVQEWAAEGCRTAGIGCIDCKKALHGEMMKTLEPIQDKAQELQKQPDQVRDVLEDGAKKAREIAVKTMEEVRERMGLRSNLGKAR